MMNRRQFCGAAAGVVVSADLARLPATEAARRQPPFRVLYSNDTTNITTCVSPWHKKGEPFRPEMLQATVDEVAGTAVDAHLLQPGLGWVPWWPSKVYPLEEHYRWLKERYGLKPDSYGRHLLAGGDLIRVFVERCRKRGPSPFISFRLNDGHGKEFVNRKPGDDIPASAANALTKFYCDHPEYRIGPDPRNWNQRVQNWAIPEVRAHKFAFLQELCENYDLDGLELDFMRHCSFFRQDRTTAEERVRTMVEFIGRVRALLDRTAKANRHRWLCVRVPAHQGAHAALGVDAQAFAAAGVELFNLSAYYFLEQQTDAATIRKQVPGAAVYLEMTPATYAGPALDQAGGNDNFSFRRATDEQFYTAAHLAHARGLDGVSLFNFAYYREHGAPGRGPFAEPPFHVLRRLGDPAWLARQPQHYLLAHVWDEPYVPDRQMGNHRKPRAVKPGQPAQFTLDLASPAGGWKKGGTLRLQGRKPLGQAVLMVRVNGQAVGPTDMVAEPYPNPYPPLLGTPETLRAWAVPAGVLRDRLNRIEVAMEKGEPAELIFLDLSMPDGRPPR